MFKSQAETKQPISDICCLSASYLAVCMMFSLA